MAGASHTGKAGQLAAMAEFLLAGYNVAIPEVDTGDDVYVVHDLMGRFWRVQVKTGTAERMQYGHRAQFWIPLAQLHRRILPAFIYVLALRRGVGDWEFVVIPRHDLRREHRAHDLGSVREDDLRLYLAFHEADVVCSGRSLQRYRNNFDLTAYR